MSGSFYALTAGLLFGLGIHGLLVGAGLIRRLLALNVMASSVFLYLVVLAQRPGQDSLDPVPQAMVLTGIVVAVSVTAFGLALVRWLRAKDGSATSNSSSEPDDASDD